MFIQKLSKSNLICTFDVVFHHIYKEPLVSKKEIRHSNRLIRDHVYRSSHYWCN